MAQVLHKLYEFAVGHASSDEDDDDESSSYVTDSSEESRLRRRERLRREKKQHYQEEQEQQRKRRDNKQTSSKNSSNGNGRKGGKKSSYNASTTQDRRKTKATTTTPTSSNHHRRSNSTGQVTTTATSSSSSSSGSSSRLKSTGASNTTKDRSSSGAIKKSSWDHPPTSNNTNHHHHHHQKRSSGTASSSTKKKITPKDDDSLTQITLDDEYSSSHWHPSLETTAADDISSVTSSVALNEYSTMSRYIRRSKSLPRSSSDATHNHNLPPSNTYLLHSVNEVDNYITTATTTTTTTNNNHYHQQQHGTTNNSYYNNNNTIPYNNSGLVGVHSMSTFDTQEQQITTQGTYPTFHSNNTNINTMDHLSINNPPYNGFSGLYHLPSTNNGSTTPTTYVPGPQYHSNGGRADIRGANPIYHGINTFDSFESIATTTAHALYPSAVVPGLEVANTKASQIHHPFVTNNNYAISNQHQPYTTSDPYNISGMYHSAVDQGISTSTFTAPITSRPLPQKRLGSQSIQEFDKPLPLINSSGLLYPQGDDHTVSALQKDVVVTVPPTIQRTDTKLQNAFTDTKNITGTPDFENVNDVGSRQQSSNLITRSQSAAKVSPPLTEKKSSRYSSISKLVETFPALNGKKGSSPVVVGQSIMEATEKKMVKQSSNVPTDSPPELVEKNLIRHNSSIKASGSVIESSLVLSHNNKNIVVQSVDKILEDLDERKSRYESFGQSAEMMSPARFSMISDGQSLSLCYTASEHGSMTYSVSDVVSKETKKVVVPNSEEALLIELLRQNTPQSHMQMIELLNRSPSIPNEGSYLSYGGNTDESADEKASESEDGILSLVKSESSNDATETSSITLDEEDKPKQQMERSSVFARTAVNLLKTTGPQNNLVRDILKKTLTSPIKSLEILSDDPSSSQAVDKNISELDKNKNANDLPDNVVDFIEKNDESSQVSFLQPLNILSGGTSSEANSFSAEKDDGILVVSGPATPSDIVDEVPEAGASKTGTVEASSTELDNHLSDFTSVEAANSSFPVPSAAIGADYPNSPENEVYFIDEVKNMAPPPPPSLPPPKRKTGLSKSSHKMMAEGHDLSIGSQPFALPPKPSSEQSNSTKISPLPPPPPPPSLPPEIIKVESSKESVKINLGAILAKRKAAAILIQKVARKCIYGSLSFHTKTSKSNSSATELLPYRISGKAEIEELERSSSFNEMPLAAFASVIKIQIWFRRYLLRQPFLVKRTGLYGLMHLERKKRVSGFDSSFYLFKLGAIQIQKTWRRSFCRNMLFWVLEQEYSVCALQTFFRVALNRIRFSRTRAACIVIQTMYRSLKGNSNFNLKLEVSNSRTLTEVFHSNFDSHRSYIDNGFTTESKAPSFSSPTMGGWECWGAFADFENSTTDENFNLSSFAQDPFPEPKEDGFSQLKADFAEEIVLFETEQTDHAFNDSALVLGEDIPLTPSLKNAGVSSALNNDKKDENCSSLPSVTKDQSRIKKLRPVQLVTRIPDTKEDDVSSFGSKSELSESAWDKFDEEEDVILTAASKNRRIARVPILKQLLPSKSSSRKSSPKTRYAECNTQYVPPRIELSPSSKGGKPPATAPVVTPSPRGKSRKQLRGPPSLNEGDEPGLIPPRPTVSSSPRSMFYSRKLHDEACEEMF